MIDLLAAAKSPHIDYELLAPLLCTAGGAVVVLMAGLAPGRAAQRGLLPPLAILALAGAIFASINVWEPGAEQQVIEGAIAMDTLTLFISILCYTAGIATVVFTWRSDLLRETGAGELYALLLASLTGMTVLAGAENLVTLFVGLELLSIPLYVMCAALMRDRRSVESGLKYLIVGSVGSATLLYGLALIYGATGSTDFNAINAAIGDRVGLGDPMLLAGIGLVLAGLAFKASVAPFHQWTPDVYQGAPTAVTAFMAVATKAAAIAVMLRFLLDAVPLTGGDWAPILAVLAAFTIVAGNVGAIAQRSLKRMLAWSGVAQAGYMLAGVVVATKLGMQAAGFYLAAYLLMNVAAFSVVIARERVSEHGDDIESLRDLGRAAPWLAWPMTISMLALAGIPATAGFIGKFYLIDAAVADGYEWLGIAIVVGSMISLVYYLRVIAVMWMGDSKVALPTDPPRRVHAVSGWSPEADAKASWEITAIAVLAAAATVFFGIVPSPLFDIVRDLGSSFPALL